MSTSPYSLDLRKKVIEYINKGNSQKKASSIFNIHKNTISRWCVRKRKEGILSPKIRLGFKSQVDKIKLQE